MLAVFLRVVCRSLRQSQSKRKTLTPRKPPTHVQVEAVHLGPIDRIVTADAVLYPINQANVTSKISAPVKRVLVKRGDHVKAGQLLAELESRDLTAAAATKASSQYDQAEANYRKPSTAPP